MKVLRIFKIGSTHSMRVAEDYVPSPTNEHVAEAFQKPASPRDQRLHDELSRRSDIGPAPTYPATTPTNAPPSMADAVIKHRKGK